MPIRQKRQTRKKRKSVPAPPKATIWPRGSIVYICGESPVLFGPSDKDLGGSETAVVELSKSWASRSYGRPVVVYGNVKETTKDGVEYRDIRELNLADKFDTAILWRSYGVRFLPVIEARVILFDLHDSWDPKLYVPASMILDKVHRVMVKSNYHKSLYDYIPASKIKVLMNGIKTDIFEKITDTNIKRDPFRIIYASSYERGLEQILEFTWPLIKKAIPEAEFHIYYGMNRLKKTPLGKKLQRLFKMPGVFEHGRVSHEEIAKAKCQSAIHLYVSTSETEIDCISVRESLICGAVPVLGNDYVFKERDGVHVPGSTDSPETFRKAAATVIKLLKSPGQLDHLRKKLMKSKTIISWDEVAERWLDIMN